MSLFETKPRTVTPLIDLSPGVFAKINQTYVLPTAHLKANTPIRMVSLPGSCMFQMYQGLIEEDLRAYIFSSAFTVINGGGYLLTKIGQQLPQSYTVILRTSDLIVYSFANSGALAVSMQVNRRMEQILESQ